MFREQPFVYTLDPPKLADNAMDEFLFETRRGFCEHYASAYTLVMRAAGVPARVVTGYQGGEFNPIGGYLIVRQSDAHAWSEIWVDGRGWLRVDPTAAVAPERIEQNLVRALAEDEPAPGRLRDASALWLQVELTWDTLNDFWNERVVRFSAARQMNLLERLGFEDRTGARSGSGLPRASRRSSSRCRCTWPGVTAPPARLAGPPARRSRAAAGQARPGSAAAEGRSPTSNVPSRPAPTSRATWRRSATCTWTCATARFLPSRPATPQAPREPAAT